MPNSLIEHLEFNFYWKRNTLKHLHLSGIVKCCRYAVFITWWTMWVMRRLLVYQYSTNDENCSWRLSPGSACTKTKNVNRQKWFGVAFCLLRISSATGLKIISNFLIILWFQFINQGSELRLAANINQGRQ